MDTSSDPKNGDINLLSRYPISRRFIVKKTILWFFLVAVTITLYDRVINPDALMHQFSSPSSEDKWFFMALVALAVLIAKTIYTILYRRTVRFSLSGDALILRKGVMIRHEVSYPLATLTNVGISRSFLDVCLAISSIRLATANDASDNFGSLEGISSRNASDLDRYIRSLVAERQQMRLPPELLQQLKEGVAAK